MTLPTFLIIGAAKAGSTSLHLYLEQHPDIYMSAVKDADFFAVEGQTLDYSGPGSNRGMRKAITRLEDYEGLFAGVQNERAFGEASNIYLYRAKTAERIKHHIPEAKLIAIIRNPVDRAFSNFLHATQAGIEPYGDFADAIDNEDKRIEENWHPFLHYKSAGFYYKQLKPFFDVFDPGQMRIYLYEELRDDSVGLAQDIFDFLGVDPSFSPDVSHRYNVTGIPKSRLLHKIVGRKNPVKSALKPLLTEKLRHLLHQKVSMKLKQSNLSKPQIAPETRQHLIDVYREDVLQLQDLIRRDLSSWLERPAEGELSRSELVSRTLGND